MEESSCPSNLCIVGSTSNRQICLCIGRINIHIVALVAAVQSDVVALKAMFDYCAGDG